jgi:hypothetical protein
VISEKWRGLGFNGPANGMCGSWPQRDHPYLDPSNCRKTSDPDTIYNCIAFAVGETHRWWWPLPRRGINYWPRGVPREETVDAFISAFGTVGFTECSDGKLEPGVEKIALFVKVDRGFLIPTHAARQLESGEWTSKMGTLEDIQHPTADAPRGPYYGQPYCYLARPRPQPQS